MRDFHSSDQDKLFSNLIEQFVGDWIEPIAKSVGAKVLVTDDADGFKPVVDDDCITDGSHLGAVGSGRSLWLSLSQEQQP